MDAKKKEISRDFEIWRNFLVFHKEVITKIENDLKKENCISLAWYDVLIVLERAEGKSLPLKELLSETVLTKSGVSKIMDRIEEAGMIKRKKSKHDARSLFIEITNDGSSEVRRAWQIYKLGILKYFLNRLSTEQKGVMKSCLVQLRAGSKQ